MWHRILTTWKLRKTPSMHVYRDEIFFYGHSFDASSLSQSAGAVVIDKIDCELCFSDTQRGVFLWKCISAVIKLESWHCRTTPTMPTNSPISTWFSAISGPLPGLLRWKCSDQGPISAFKRRLPRVWVRIVFPTHRKCSRNVELYGKRGNGSVAVRGDFVVPSVDSLDHRLISRIPGWRRVELGKFRKGTRMIFRLTERARLLLVRSVRSEWYPLLLIDWLVDFDLLNWWLRRVQAVRLLIVWLVKYVLHSLRSWLFPFFGNTESVECSLFAWLVYQFSRYFWNVRLADFLTGWQ